MSGSRPADASWALSVATSGGIAFQRSVTDARVTLKIGHGCLLSQVGAASTAWIVVEELFRLIECVQFRGRAETEGRQDSPTSRVVFATLSICSLIGFSPARCLRFGYFCQRGPCIFCRLAATPPASAQSFCESSNCFVSSAVVAFTRGSIFTRSGWVKRLITRGQNDRIITGNDPGRGRALAPFCPGPRSSDNRVPRPATVPRAGPRRNGVARVRSTMAAAISPSSAESSGWVRRRNRIGAGITTDRFPLIVPNLERDRSGNFFA